MTAGLRPDPAALRGDLRPLPAAELRGAPGRWRAAYRDAAAGRYAAALEQLGGLVDHPRPEVASSALRLRASVWRQLTRYGRSERDGAAAAALGRLGDPAAGAGEPPTGGAELAAAAAAGRVADAVGRLQAGETAADAVLDERLAEAEAALDRLLGRRPGGAGGGQTRAGVDPRDDRQLARHVVRLAWVGGEVALTRGDARAAHDRFTAALRTASEAGLRRHAAKSAAFLAAASMATGDVEGAGRLARDAAAEAAAMGAEPVRWPALLLAAEAAHRVGDAEEGAAGLRRAAVVLDRCLRGLPAPLRAEIVAAPPASWLLPHGGPASDGAAEPTPAHG